MTKILEKSKAGGGSLSLEKGNSPRPVAIIENDAQAIAVARELADHFRKGAIERDQKRLTPAQQIEQLTQAGLYGITVPKKYGGPDVSAVTLAEVFRLISAADPSIGQIPQNHFCWIPLFETGTPEQEAFFYGRVLQGDRLGNANSEKGRRRPGDFETGLERVEGGYVLTGKKYYATGALFAQWIPIITKDGEQMLMVFARRDSEGLEVINDWAGMGQRTTASGTVVLNRVFVPDNHVVPFYKQAEKPISFALLGSLIHAAIDLGIAEEAYGDAKNYILTKSRPWIENPFDEHAKEPFIVHRFGELSVELHAAQALLRLGAEKLDEAKEDPTPEKVNAARFAIADARILTGNAAIHISSELFGMTGASATLEPYDLDRHWRNARTHTLHDPTRWKYFHIGNYHLNNLLPPPGAYT